MKHIFFFIIGTFLFASCEQPQSVTYEDSNFILILTSKSSIIKHVELINKRTCLTYSCTLQLIKVDGEVPEGELYSDYNTSNIYDFYKCDSVYYVDNDSINLTIALESINHKRLDLCINESKIYDYKDGAYTLYKILK